MPAHRPAVLPVHEADIHQALWLSASIGEVLLHPSQPAIGAGRDEWIISDNPTVVLIGEVDVVGPVGPRRLGCSPGPTAVLGVMNQAVAENPPDLWCQ